MKFKEFVRWCSDRAADGCWDAHTAMFCIGVLDNVSSYRWWKREKRWQELSKKFSIVENVVMPIDNRRREKLS